MTEVENEMRFRILQLAVNTVTADTFKVPYSAVMPRVSAVPENSSTPEIILWVAERYEVYVTGRDAKDTSAILKVREEPGPYFAQ